PSHRPDVHLPLRAVPVVSTRRAEGMAIVPVRIHTALPTIIPRGAVTLAALVEPFLLWLRLVRRRKLLTVVAYGQALRTFLDFCTGAGLVTPEQVRPRTIGWYLAWLQEERRLCATSANRHLHTLCSFWGTSCTRRSPWAILRLRRSRCPSRNTSRSTSRSPS